MNIKAYSYDLRSRVISTYEDGSLSRKEIANFLKISYETVCNWIRRYETTGEYSSKQGVGCGREARFNDRDNILNYLEKNPDADGIDMRDALAPGFPMSTWYDTLSRLDITYKKRAKIQTEKCGKARRFYKKIAKIEASNLVYVDETGFDANIVVQYGWFSKSKRSYAEQSGFKKERLSIVAGYVYGTKEFIAPF